MSFTKLPTEMQLEIINYLDVQDQASLAALQGTHNVAMDALYRNLGPIRLDRLGGNPMTLKFAKKYARLAKKLCIHFHLTTDVAKLSKYQGMLKEIFKIYHDQLHVLAFSAFEFLDEEVYQAVADFLQTQSQLRFVVLPKLERGHGPFLKNEDIRSPFSAVVEVSTPTHLLKVYIRRGADLDVAKAVIDRSRQKIESVTIFGQQGMRMHQVNFFSSRVGLRIPFDLQKLKFHFFNCALLHGNIRIPNLRELTLVNCADAPAHEAYLSSLRHLYPNLKVCISPEGP